jgi:hypothetical protein
MTVSYFAVVGSLTNNICDPELLIGRPAMA